MISAAQLRAARALPGIEWQLSIDREQAGRYQAGIASVGSMVQLVTNGVLPPSAWSS